MFPQLIENFKNRKILVIGDFMLDEYITGVVERISPEAPVPVVLEKSRRFMPGGAGNVVCNLQSLGARTFLAGVIGDDVAGNQLNDIFISLGVTVEETKLIRLPNRQTTRKTRIIAGNQQLCRLDTENENAIDAQIEEQIIESIKVLLPEVNGIIFSDYGKGVITQKVIQETVKQAKREDLFLAVDPQIDHFRYYKHINVLTPNHHEAAAFLGRRLKEKDEIKAAGFEILEKLQSEMLLITQGEKGMSLFEAKSGSFKHFPTEAREVFDVSGAGDTVISVFSLAMVAGATPEEAVILSNKSAGIVVGKLGAATVTRKELLSN